MPSLPPYFFPEENGINLLLHNAWFMPLRESVFQASILILSVSRR
jgi:hypothetical protein